MDGVSRVPDASRGRRVAQSDGLVCLIILSADGHPQGASGHAPARSQQLPTAVSPKKIFASFLRLFSQGNLVETHTKKKNKKDTAYIIPIYSKYENSPVLVEMESCFIFRNKAVAARFGI